MASALPGCAIFTHEFRGAASRVAREATAFGLRRDHVLVELLTTFGDLSVFDERRYQRWLRALLNAFDAIALPGGYPNLLPEGDTGRATKSFGGNAERLIKAKRTYDSENIFAPPFPFRSCAVSKSLGAQPYQPGTRRRFQQRGEVAF